MWRFSPLIEFTGSSTELSTELYSKAQNLLVLKLDGLQCILKGNMFWDQHLLGWFIPYSSLEGGRNAGVKSTSLGEYVKRQILSQVTSEFSKFSWVTALVSHKDSGVLLEYSIFSSFDYVYTINCQFTFAKYIILLKLCF